MYDSSIKALTPEGIEFVLSPVGLTIRTFAYAIDKTIQWLLLLIITIIFILSQNAIGFWLVLILNFCIDWFYHVICELAFRGQSPGKRFMGIRVVRSDGSPVDPASSFLRNLLRFADTFFFLFPIAFISIATSRGFRRLGDWAGGTLVVYATIAKNSQHTSLISLLSKHQPVTSAAPLSHDEKQAILNFARRYPLLGEARANEIAGIYAPYLKNNNDDLSNTNYLLGIAHKLSGAGNFAVREKQ
ncbi:MAG: RDD family protein [Treponema sp.]|nr:RDD family protein [Treponema sp.]